MGAVVFPTATERSLETELGWEGELDRIGMTLISEDGGQEGAGE